MSYNSGDEQSEDGELRQSPEVSRQKGETMDFRSVSLRVIFLTLFVGVCHWMGLKYMTKDQNFGRTLYWVIVVEIIPECKPYLCFVYIF